MIYARALLLADGPSDEPLGRHIAALAHQHGVRLDVVAPEFDRMEMSTGLRAKARLQRMLDIDPDSTCSSCIAIVKHKPSLTA